jgi:hypothetical protein
MSDKKKDKVYVITDSKLSKKQQRDERVRKDAKLTSTTKGAWT